MEAPAEALRTTVQALSGRLQRCLEQLESLALAENPGTPGDSWLQGSKPARRISKVIHVDATGMTIQRRAARFAASMPGDLPRMHAQNASSLRPIVDASCQQPHVLPDMPQDVQPEHQQHAGEHAEELIPAWHDKIDILRPQVLTVASQHTQEKPLMPATDVAASDDIPATQYTELNALMAEQGMDLQELLRLLSHLDSDPGATPKRPSQPYSSPDPTQDAPQQPRITTGSQMAAELYDMLAKDAGSPRSSKGQQAGRSIGGDSSGNRWGWACCKSNAGATTSGDGTTEACSPRSAMDGAAASVQVLPASTQSKQAVAVQVPSQPASNGGVDSSLQEAVRGSPRAALQLQVSTGSVTGADAVALHGWLQQQHQLLLTLMHALEVGSEMQPAPAASAMENNHAASTGVDQEGTAAGGADMQAVEQSAVSATLLAARGSSQGFEGDTVRRSSASRYSRSSVSETSIKEQGNSGEKEGIITRHASGSSGSMAGTNPTAERSKSNDGSMRDGSVGADIGRADGSDCGGSTRSTRSSDTNSHIFQDRISDGSAAAAAVSRCSDDHGASIVSRSSCGSMHSRLPKRSSVHSEGYNKPGSSRSSSSVHTVSPASRALSNVDMLPVLPGLGKSAEMQPDSVGTIQPRSSSGASCAEPSSMTPAPLAAEQSLSRWPTFLQRPDGEVDTERRSTLSRWPAFLEHPDAGPDAAATHAHASARVSEASMAPVHPGTDLAAVYAEIQAALAQRRASDAARLGAAQSTAGAPADSSCGGSSMSAAAITVQQYQREVQEALYCYHNPVYRSRSTAATEDSVATPTSPMQRSQLTADVPQPSGMEAVMLGLAYMLHVMKQTGRSARSTTHSDHAMVVPLPAGQKPNSEQGSLASWSGSGMGDAPIGSVSATTTDDSMALEGTAQRISNASELQWSSGLPSRRSTYSAALPGSLPPSYPCSRRNTGRLPPPETANDRQAAEVEQGVTSHGGASVATSDCMGNDDAASVSPSQYSAGLPDTSPYELHSMRSTAHNVDMQPAVQICDPVPPQEQLLPIDDEDGNPSGHDATMSPRSQLTCGSRRSTYSAHLPDLPPSHLSSQRTTAGGSDGGDSQTAVLENLSQGASHDGEVLQDHGSSRQQSREHGSEGGASRCSLYSAVLPAGSAAALPSARTSEHSTLAPSQHSSGRAVRVEDSPSQRSTRTTSESSYLLSNPRGMSSSSLKPCSCNSRTSADTSVMPSARTTEHDPVLPFTARQTTDSAVLPGGVRTTQHSSMLAMNTRAPTASAGGASITSTRSRSSMPAPGAGPDLPSPSRSHTPSLADSSATTSKAHSKCGVQRSTASLVDGGSEEPCDDSRRVTSYSAIEGVPQRLGKPPPARPPSKAGSARHSTYSMQLGAGDGNRRASVGSAVEGVLERAIITDAVGIVTEAAAASASKGASHGCLVSIEPGCHDPLPMSVLAEQCNMASAQGAAGSVLPCSPTRREGSNGGTQNMSEAGDLPMAVMMDDDVYDSLAQYTTASTAESKRPTEVSTCSTTSISALPVSATAHPLGRSPSRHVPMQPAQMAACSNLHPAMQPCRPSAVHQQQPISPPTSNTRSARVTTAGGSCVSAVTDVLSSTGVCEVVVADGLYGSPVSSAAPSHGGSSSCMAAPTQGGSSSCNAGPDWAHSIRLPAASCSGSRQRTCSQMSHRTASCQSASPLEAGSPVANRASTSAYTSKCTTAGMHLAADSQSAADTVCDEEEVSPRSTYSAHLPDDDAGVADVKSPCSPVYRAATVRSEAQEQELACYSSDSPESVPAAASLPDTAASSARVTAGSMAYNATRSTYTASLPDMFITEHRPASRSMDVAVEVPPATGHAAGLLPDMGRASCSPRAGYASTATVEPASSRHATQDSVAGPATCSTYAASLPDVNAVTPRTTDDALPESLANMHRRTSSTYAASLPDADPIACEALQFSVDTMLSIDAACNHGPGTEHNMPAASTAGKSARTSAHGSSQATQPPPASPPSTVPMQAAPTPAPTIGLQQAMSVLLEQLAGSAAGDGLQPVNDALLADLGRALLAAVAPQHGISQPAAQQEQQLTAGKGKNQHQQQQRQEEEEASNNVSHAVISNAVSKARALSLPASTPRSSSIHKSSSNRSTSEVQGIAVSAVAALNSPAPCQQQWQGQAGWASQHAADSTSTQLACPSTDATSPNSNQCMEPACSATGVSCAPSIQVQLSSKGGSLTASAWEPSSVAGMTQAGATPDTSMGGASTASAAPNGSVPAWADPAAAARWEAMWSRFSSMCAAAGHPVPEPRAMDASAWEAMWSRFSSRSPTAPAAAAGGDSIQVAGAGASHTQSVASATMHPGAHYNTMHASAAAAEWNTMWDGASSTPRMSVAGSQAASGPRVANAPAATPMQAAAAVALAGAISLADCNPAAGSPAHGDLQLTAEEWSAMWSAWGSARKPPSASSPSAAGTMHKSCTEQSSPQATVDDYMGSRSSAPPTACPTAGRSSFNTCTSRYTPSAASGAGRSDRPSIDNDSLQMFSGQSYPSSQSGRRSEPAYGDEEGSEVSQAMLARCRHALAMQGHAVNGISSGEQQYGGLNTIAGLLHMPGTFSPVSASSHHNGLCELLLRSLSRSGPYTGPPSGGSTEAGSAAASADSSDSRLLQLVLQIIAGQDEQATASALQRVLSSKSVQCSVAGSERGPASQVSAAVTTRPSSCRTTTSSMMPLLHQQHQQHSSGMQVAGSSDRTGGGSFNDGVTGTAAQVQPSSQAELASKTVCAPGRQTGVTVLPAANAQLTVNQCLHMQQQPPGTWEQDDSRLPAGPPTLQVHRCSSTNVRPAGSSRPGSMHSDMIMHKQDACRAVPCTASADSSYRPSMEDFHSPAASTPTLLSTGGALDGMAHGETPASPASSAGRGTLQPAVADMLQHISSSTHQSSDDVLTALQGLLQQATAVMKAHAAKSCGAQVATGTCTATAVSRKLEPNTSNVSSLSGSSEDQAFDSAGLKDALQACRVVAAAYRHLDKTARSTAHPASSRLLAQLLEVQATKPHASDLLAHLPQAQRQAVLYCTFTAWRQLITHRQHDALHSSSNALQQQRTPSSSTQAPAVAMTVHPTQHGSSTAYSSGIRHNSVLGANSVDVTGAGSRTDGGRSSTTSVSSCAGSAHTSAYTAISNSGHTDAHMGTNNSGRLTRSGSMMSSGQGSISHTAGPSMASSIGGSTPSSASHHAELQHGIHEHMAVAMRVSSQRPIRPLDSHSVLQGTSVARSCMSTSTDYIPASSSALSSRTARSPTADVVMQHQRPGSAGRVRALSRPSVMVHDALMDVLQCRPSSASSRRLVGVHTTHSVCTSASVTQTSMGGASDASGPRGTFSSVASSHGHAYRCSDGSAAGMVASRAGLCSPRSPTTAYP